MSINRRKQILNAFLALVVASGGGYLGYKVMEKRIVEQKYIKVVAVKEGHLIEPYTPILASDLTYLPMSKDHPIPGVFTEPSKVVGKRTFQKVGELNPVLDWQLTEDKLLPDPNKKELQYEFNLSDFGTLTAIRTGDTVGIWVKYTPEVDRQEGELPKVPTLFKKTNQAADLLFISTAAGIKDGEGAEVFSLLPPKLSTAVGDTVQQVVEGSDTRDRLAATFRGKPTMTPAKILLNLTPEQHKVLQEARQFGDWQIGVSLQGKVVSSIADGKVKGGRP
ncbi:hypothetical protein [Brevibacillus sp. SYSU BS000544]|uniref:hypothetical protein n=1 Tax=Brevibacillus sp. SYSU BS000544 TaxID=3416443 RepID=UPI003CE54864